MSIVERDRILEIGQTVRFAKCAEGEFWVGLSMVLRVLRVFNSPATRVFERRSRGKKIGNKWAKSLRVKSEIFKATRFILLYICYYSLCWLIMSVVACMRDVHSIHHLSFRCP